MSNFVKCFDIVSMVVEEATNRFSPLWEINKERYDILRQYCDVLDSLVTEFNGESFEVEVDDINMTIAITMECNEITIESKNHMYYSLAQRTTSFGFSVSDDGLLCAKFVFPSIWEKV